jgi:hypothetical protein
LLNGFVISSMLRAQVNWNVLPVFKVLDGLLITALSLVRLHVFFIAAFAHITGWFCIGFHGVGTVQFSSFADFIHSISTSINAIKAPLRDLPCAMHPVSFWIDATKHRSGSLHLMETS